MELLDEGVKNHGISISFRIHFISFYFLEKLFGPKFLVNHLIDRFLMGCLELGKMANWGEILDSVLLG